MREYKGNVWFFRRKIAPLGPMEAIPVERPFRAALAIYNPAGFSPCGDMG